MRHTIRYKQSFIRPEGLHFFFLPENLQRDHRRRNRGGLETLSLKFELYIRIRNPIPTEIQLMVFVYEHSNLSIGPLHSFSPLDSEGWRFDTKYTKCLIRIECVIQLYSFPFLSNVIKDFFPYIFIGYKTELCHKSFNIFQMIKHEIQRRFVVSFRLRVRMFFFENLFSRRKTIQNDFHNYTLMH